jgi:hypothetical protein
MSFLLALLIVCLVYINAKEEVACEGPTVTGPDANKPRTDEPSDPPVAYCLNNPVMVTMGGANISRFGITMIEESYRFLKNTFSKLINILHHTSS